MTPCTENLPDALARELAAANLPSWALYWADGRRDLGTIRRLLTAHLRRPVGRRQVEAFFEAHAAVGFVEFDPRPESSGDALTSPGGRSQ